MEEIVKQAEDLAFLCLNLAEMGYVHKDTMVPISFSPDGPLHKLRSALYEYHQKKTQKS